MKEILDPINLTQLVGLVGRNVAKTDLNVGPLTFLLRELAWKNSQDSANPQSEIGLSATTDGLWDALGGRLLALPKNVGKK
jgi:hypothetical protein